LTRCVRCNGVLEPVRKDDVLDRLPRNTARYYDEFKVCDGCGQVYWRGSHFERLEAFVGEVLGRVEREG